MLGYVTIGAADHAKSVAFYDAVFATLGYARAFDKDGWAGYGPKGSDKPDIFVVSATANGEPAKAGNGIMLSFKAKTPAEVDAAHKAGMKIGGKDEGKPGPRPPDSKEFYGAYLRDPTGNKFCVFARGPF
jgi:catechol 2,3-dioxygenase-like lactoylglutathione lyase family enzyme